MSDTITLWIDEEGRALNTESDMLGNYRDMLDEVYGIVSVAGYDYDTSRLLEQADEVAFRTGFLDYCDAGWTEVEVPLSEWIADTERAWLIARGYEVLTEEEL